MASFKKAVLTRNACQQKLSKHRSNDKPRRDLERTLWFLNGVVEHALDARVLKPIFDHHMRLDSYPVMGYKYPGLL